MNNAILYWPYHLNFWFDSNCIMVFFWLLFFSYKGILVYVQIKQNKKNFDTY